MVFILLNILQNKLCFILCCIAGLHENQFSAGQTGFTAKHCYRLVHSGCMFMVIVKLNKV